MSLVLSVVSLAIGTACIAYTTGSSWRWLRLLGWAIFASHCATWIWLGVLRAYDIHP